MEMTLEVIVVPVADVERAKDFYAGKLGFNVDTDAQLSDDFRVVQLTIDRGPPRPAEPDDQLDYRGFAFFQDPDGNAWAIQQLSAPLAERTAALAAAEGPRGAPDA